MTPLLTLDGLKVHFPIGERGLLRDPAGVVRAVDGVSLSIFRGETFGLVGESGSGKSTLGRAILRAVEPTAGRVLFLHDGQEVDVTRLDRKALRVLRRNMQMIFQDPYSSLNPRMSVFDILAEPLIAQNLARGSELQERVAAMAERCGLSREQLGRYPHAFSGGQRQRIAIARALVTEPAFVVADEPISALDVSIQAQILNLMEDLKQELGLTFLFIAHDLAAVARVCGRIAVMYLGQVVEIADSRDIVERPKHPYTAALMSAIPIPDPDRPMRPLVLQGERPSPAAPPPGCRFHTRCRHATALCASEMPELRTVLEPEAGNRLVACHHAEKLELGGATECAPSDAAGASG